MCFGQCNAVTEQLMSAAVWSEKLLLEFPFISRASKDVGGAPSDFVLIVSECPYEKPVPE